MHCKFDELARGVTQSTARRNALKKYGATAAGALLASL
jgi:hypothetical protein